MTHSLDKYHFNAARQETGERSQKTSSVLDKICSEVKVRYLLRAGDPGGRLVSSFPQNTAS